MLNRDLPEINYRSYLYLLLPIICKDSFDEVFLIKSERRQGVHLRVQFNTYFNLTSSDKHVLIQIALFGFGFEFFLKTS